MMRQTILFIVSSLLLETTFATEFCLDEEDFATKLKKTAVENLCKKPFKKSEWDKLTDGITLSKPTNEDLYIYLLRFAKPGGFDPDNEAHTHFLNKILRDEHLLEKYQKEIIFALHQISVKQIERDNPDYLDSFFDRIHQMDSKNLYKKIPYLNHDESCLTEKEKESLRDKSFQQIADHLKRWSPDARMCKMPNYIEVAIPSLAKLDEQKQLEIIKPLYRLTALCLTERTRGAVTTSKSIAFTKNHIKRKFGKDVPQLTDAAATDSGVFILSTSGIEILNKEEDRRYIHQEVIAGINVAINYEIKDNSWKTNGKKYLVDVEKVDIDIKQLIDSSKAPDYKKMLEDNEFSGITLIGSNLGFGSQNAVTEKYISYYVDKGFEFSNPQDETNTLDWLKTNISNGKIDYIIKEAHTGGNDYDLLGVSGKHKIMTGTKTKSDGTKEVIHILMPQEYSDSDNGSGSKRLTFKNMEEWMNKREEANKGPLLYLNSSCHSMQTAGREIAGIQSKLFLDIAAPSTTTTFFNGKNSTKYQIMEQLREQKSYEEIRKAMATTTRHKDGYNQFIFPDEKKYLENISNAHAVKIEIKDENGNPYFLHQELEH